MYEKDKTLHGEDHSRTARDMVAGGKIVQMIVFNLGDEEFGIDIDQVREIIGKGSITPIPDSPDYISGMTNVRGEIAVVIDLKKRFLLTSERRLDEKHIVIAEHDKNLFGFIVDEVTEVLRIRRGEIRTTPEIVDGTYFFGIITLGERLIMLLDLQTVLSEEELANNLPGSGSQLPSKFVGEKAEKIVEDEPERSEEPKQTSCPRRHDQKNGGMSDEKNSDRR